MKLLLIKCSISFILLTAIDNLSCCQLNESNQFTMLLKWARLLLAIWIDLPQATRHILHIIMSYSSVVSWFVRRSGKSKRWKARTLKLFAVNRKTQTNGGEARRKKQGEFEIIDARRRREERLNWWIEIRQHAVYIYLFRKRKRLILHSIVGADNFVWVCLHCLQFPPAIAAGQSPTIWLNDE